MHCDSCDCASCLDAYVRAREEWSWPKDEEEAKKKKKKAAEEAKKKKAEEEAKKKAAEEAKKKAEELYHRLGEVEQEIWTLLSERRHLRRQLRD